MILRIENHKYLQFAMGFLTLEGAICYELIVFLICVCNTQAQMRYGMLHLNKKLFCEKGPVNQCMISLTLAVRGLEEHVRVSLIFAIIVSLKLFTVFTLANVLYFEQFIIHDSCGFMILKNN